MKSGNSKLVLGLIVGAAVGAAAVYLMNKENRDDILEQINDTIDCAKKKIGKAIDQGIEEMESAVDKVSTLAQAAATQIKNTDLEAGDE